MKIVHRISTQQYCPPYGENQFSPQNIIEESIEEVASYSALVQTIPLLP